MSLKLYAAVLTYFAAGVLKVRAMVKKTVPYRLLMVVYCAAAPAFCYVMNIPVILLLPLVENIVSVIMMREERLRSTGNIELIKGAVFLILASFFWK